MVKGKLNKKIKLTIILSFMILIISFSVVLASGSNFQLPLFLNKYEVYTGGSNYSPNYSNYPFNKNTVKAIGFDVLYGSDKVFLKYKGEVPYETSKEDYAKKYRVYNGNKINTLPRPFSNEIISDKDLIPSNKNPHIWAMTTSSSYFGGIGEIGLSIVVFINYIFTMIINLMITLKSFDVSTIVSTIDSGGTFSKLLASLFLIDNESGAISPLLIFSLLLFIISFISLSFKAINGKKSLRNIMPELGFFIISIAIASIFLNTGNASILSKTGTDFITAFGNKITTSSNSSSSIFEYNTGNADIDRNETQRGIISKTYIDQCISGQFGYNINDLYIANDAGLGSFGTKDEVQEAMTKTFGIGSSEDSMSVSTDIYGKNKINNLGYYLWAANSGVAIYNGTGNINPIYYTSGSSTLVHTGSSDRILYVIDFLSNVRKIQETKGSTGMVIVNKVDRIMNNLTNPDYSAAMANIFAVTIQNIALSYALLAIAIFEIIGRMIIVFGSYCMVVLPILILFKGTRSTAKKMCWSYMIGFLRYLIGSALFNTIIIISTLLAQQGFMGIIISAILCFILGKFGPNIIKEINAQITSFGRGKELGAMSNMYHKMDRGLDKYSNKNKRQNKGFVLNDNGDIERDKSSFEKIQEGLRKGENPFETEAGINPFGKKRNLYKKDQIDKFNSNEKINDDDLKEILVENMEDLSVLEYKNFIEKTNINNNPGNTKIIPRSIVVDDEEDIWAFEKFNMNNNFSGIGNSVIEDDIDVLKYEEKFEHITFKDNQMRSGRSLIEEDEDENFVKVLLNGNLENNIEKEILLDIHENDEIIFNETKNNTSLFEKNEKENEKPDNIDNDDEFKFKETYQRNKTNNEQEVFENKEKIDVLSDKDKYKLQKKKKKNIKLKNVILKTINNVPYIGKDLNEYAVKKMVQPNKNKKELLEEMSKLIVTDNIENLTLDEVIQKSKNKILNNASNTTKENKFKSIDNAKTNINKSDISIIKENAKQKQEQKIIKLNKNK